MHMCPMSSSLVCLLPLIQFNSQSRKDKRNPVKDQFHLELFHLLLPLLSPEEMSKGHFEGKMREH
jgi:hypothetical protein